MRDILRLVVVLTLICAVTAGALSALKVTLAPKIERQNDFYVRGPALENLFGHPADELLSNKINYTIDDQTYPVFYMKDNSGVTGLAIEAPGHGGYGGDVYIMIGINLEKSSLIGMEIVRHSETPGVGSQIEKESFRKQWNGMPVKESYALRGSGGEIDAISGATYSSKAVLDGTNRILGLLQEHKDEIIKRIQTKHG